MKRRKSYKLLPLGSQFKVDYPPFFAFEGVDCSRFWRSPPPLCEVVWQSVAIQYLRTPPASPLLLPPTFPLLSPDAAPPCLLDLMVSLRKSRTSISIGFLIGRQDTVESGNYDCLHTAGSGPCAPALILIPTAIIKLPLTVKGKDMWFIVGGILTSVMHLSSSMLIQCSHIWENRLSQCHDVIGNFPQQIELRVLVIILLIWAGA